MEKFAFENPFIKLRTLLSKTKKENRAIIELRDETNYLLGTLSFTPQRFRTLIDMLKDYENTNQDFFERTLPSIRSGNKTRSFKPSTSFEK